MSVRDLRVVEIHGTPAERGRQYGEAAADLIAKALDYYAAAFAEQTGLGWRDVLGRARQWLPLCRASYPELVSEMEGIAEGAGVTLLDILALNVRGEIIYDTSFNDRAGEAPPTAEDRDDLDGCTSFALVDGAAGDGHVYAGQNWDWRHGALDTVMMLRVVQPPKPTVIMQVEAGQVGRHGANSAGIALNANGLGGRFGPEIGLPQTLVRRQLLDQANLTDALNVLFRTRAHIASNALLAHRSGFAIDVETTPGANGWMYPTDGLLVHGNHYQAFVPPQLAATYRPISADSLLRVPQAERGLRLCRAAADSRTVRELVHAAMSDHLGYPESVCTHPDTRRPAVRQWSTLLSSCVDLSTGEYFVTHGTPCENDYELMPWNVFDGPDPAPTSIAFEESLS